MPAEKALFMAEDRTNDAHGGVIRNVIEDGAVLAPEPEYAVFFLYRSNARSRPSLTVH